MRTCIHSSAYNPSVHTILGGPYSSTSQCESACSSPSTTLPPITTTPNPNLPLLPPIVGFWQGSNIYNINTVPVNVFAQKGPANSTAPFLWTESLSVEPILMNPKSYFSFLRNGDYYIRVRCSSLTGSNMSPWSTISYTIGGQPVMYTYPNTDNIQAPIFLGKFIIYNTNNFPVEAFVSHSNTTANAETAYLTHSPMTFSINALSSIDLSQLSNTNLIREYVRCRFAKSDLISTSVSDYGYSYA